MALMTVDCLSTIQSDDGFDSSHIISKLFYLLYSSLMLSGSVGLLSLFFKVFYWNP